MKLQNFHAAIFCAAASSSCITSLAAATEESNPLEITIVTGTRFSQPLKQSLFHTSVITEQDIQDSQAADVPTLLHSLAGVEVVQSGGLGMQSSTFMRGTESDHVLVLLDGVRVNSATAGTTALEHIMLDSIERIEVVRGNVSSLYGSEAIGGVIQIFTKRGKGEPQFNASGGVGSYNTQRLAAGFGGEAGKTAFNVQASKYKTDGVTAINTQIAPTANPDKDGYDNTSLSAQVQHVFNANHELSASLYSSRGDNSYDMSGTWQNTPADQHNSLSTIEKISIASDNRLAEIWQSHVRVAQGTDDVRDYKNSVQQSRLKTRNNQLTWQNELSVADTQKLNLAVEHLTQSVSVDDIATPNPYTQTQRTVQSLLGGYVGEYRTQQVQLNLRQDRYSDFGTANTGLLGYGLKFADSWRVTASVSNAFKAPTFNDLYRPTWGGNPNLRPERANNREVGLRYASDGQHADLIYFDNRIRDLINYPAPLYVAQNIDRARIDGWEMSYSNKFDDTQVKANLTLQNPRNTATGKLLQRRAKKYASIAASHDFGVWNMGTEVQYSGTREDYDINTYSRTTLESYTVVNLSANYAVDKRLTVTARAGNLFDKEYMLAHGYNTLGRTLFIGLNYKQ